MTNSLWSPDITPYLLSFEKFIRVWVYWFFMYKAFRITEQTIRGKEGCPNNI